MEPQTYVGVMLVVTMVAVTGAIIEVSADDRS